MRTVLSVLMAVALVGLVPVASTTNADFYEVNRAYLIDQIKAVHDLDDLDEGTLEGVAMAADRVRYVDLSLVATTGPDGGNGNDVHVGDVLSLNFGPATSGTQMLDTGTCVVNPFIIYYDSYAGGPPTVDVPFGVHIAYTELASDEVDPALLSEVGVHGFGTHYGPLCVLFNSLIFSFVESGSVFTVS